MWLALFTVRERLLAPLPTKVIWRRLQVQLILGARFPTSNKFPTTSAPPHVLENCAGPTRQRRSAVFRQNQIVILQILRPPQKNDQPQKTSGNPKKTSKHMFATSKMSGRSSASPKRPFKLVTIRFFVSAAATTVRKTGVTPQRSLEGFGTRSLRTRIIKTSFGPFHGSGLTVFRIPSWSGLRPLCPLISASVACEQLRLVQPPKEGTRFDGGRPDPPPLFSRPPAGRPGKALARIRKAVSAWQPGHPGIRSGPMSGNTGEGLFRHPHY